MLEAEERHPSWDTEQLEYLVDAIWAAKSRGELRDFLRDLCTLSELDAMAHRWHVARLLDEGLPYLEIAKRTGASTATVTRVAQWVRHGEGGYRTALERIRRARKRA
jgi:TrpR-related protein YerC/YecD